MQAASDYNRLSLAGPRSVKDSATASGAVGPGSIPGGGTRILPIDLRRINLSEFQFGISGTP